MKNRRDVLKGTLAGVIPAGSGSAVLLWSSDARAWVPVALAVAKAGFALYQMSKSGAGGIGTLLSAQVEMLRAINNQLKEIGQTVNQIYASIEQLKGMVEVLPDLTIRELYFQEVRLMTEYGGELLNSALTNTQTHGVADAIRLDAGASQAAIQRMAPAVIKVMQDRSTLNVPVMCLAWYTEYQLLTRNLVFNPALIASTARRYRDYFDRNVTLITQELDRIESETAALVQKISTSPSFENANCFEDINVQWVNHTCGSNDDNTDCSYGRVVASNVSYSTRSEVQDDQLAQFLTAASDLHAAGVTVSEALLSSKVPKWDFSRVPINRHFSGIERRGQYNSYRDQVQSRLCSAGRSRLVENFFGQQDKLVRDLEDLRIGAVVNKHLLLAASEAQRSSAVIAERISKFLA